MRIYSMDLEKWSKRWFFALGDLQSENMHCEALEGSFKPNQLQMRIREFILNALTLPQKEVQNT